MRRPERRRPNTATTLAPVRPACRTHPAQRRQPASTRSRRFDPWTYAPSESGPDVLRSACGDVRQFGDLHRAAREAKRADTKSPTLSKATDPSLPLVDASQPSRTPIAASPHSRVIGTQDGVRRPPPRDPDRSKPPSLRRFPSVRPEASPGSKMPPPRAFPRTRPRSRQA